MKSLWLIGILLACGAAGAHADHEVIGTIEADLNGEPVTWHVLAGESDAQHSATVVVHPNGRAVSLGGYESLDVTFDTTEPMPKVSGPGSMLVMAFEAPAGSSANYTIGGEPMLQILLFEEVGNFAAARPLESGTLEITDGDLSSENDGRISGTFHGQFEQLDGAPAILTDGRFEVHGIRRIER